MKYLVQLSAMMLAFSLMVGCASSSKFVPKQVTQVNPSSIRHVEGKVFSGGQPSQAEFQQLKSKGIKTVINLRQSSEIDWDQPVLLAELGINYISLPISGAAGITEDNARKLKYLIDENSNEPLLIHCASGNRVGALIATAENRIGQNDIENSIEIGKKWGLTRLEPAVRELLNRPSDTKALPASASE